MNIEQKQRDAELKEALVDELSTRFPDAMSMPCTRVRDVVYIALLAISIWERMREKERT